MEEENKNEKLEESVTREINLDELYDGAVNNTVIIDPVSKNEVLLKTRKGGGKILGIIFLILVLLLLYFVTNKLEINNKKANVKPNVTTSTTTTMAIIVKKGTLTCTYTSESSSEKQNATYKANYENNKILDSEFNYVVNLLSESSEIYDDLQKQYENFFINNATIDGISFNKDDKSFNFNHKVVYDNNDFSKITNTEGQIILYAIPSASDSLEEIQNTYTNKGYSCSTNSISGE